LNCLLLQILYLLWPSSLALACEHTLGSAHTCAVLQTGETFSIEAHIKPMQV
jgi:hypothetical protein